MKIQENKSLKNYNTFGVEARAAVFAEIINPADVKRLLDKREYLDMPRLVLGGGSNILFANDFDGLVLRIAVKGMRMINITEDFVIMEAGAGEIWQDFVEICVKNSYHGIENLAMIPGCVGAAPVQNIGAYGVEQSEFFHSLETFDLDSGRKIEMGPEECRFGYRDSAFKHELKNRRIITNVRYRLSKKENLNLSYKELEQEIKKFVVVEPNAKYLYDTVCRLRGKKLPDPSELGNAGSFFKNPLIEKDEFDKIRSKYNDVPFFSADDKVKIPAGWLIEQCGWKGRREGDAGVSEKHALILVNHGNATGREILDLAEEIRDSVMSKFGILLEYEVNII